MKIELAKYSAIVLYNLNGWRQLRISHMGGGVYDAEGYQHGRLKFYLEDFKEQDFGLANHWLETGEGGSFAR